jgi:hypothetical protein
MKLNPPATSSDIDAAREIARRLHQRRRREDRPGEPSRQAAEPRPPFRPVAPPVAVPKARPEPVPAPPSPPPPAFEAQAPYEPPAWDEPAAADDPSSDLDPLSGFGAPAPDELSGDSALPPVEVEDGGISPEEMVGAPESSPFEELSESAYDAPSPFEEEGDVEPPIEQVYESTAPPSWDEIVDTCLAMAQATGAMLVDPAGQVFAARGEWPEPGPDAIAAKLVSTMERTLKDAPTRSISAPLQGKHLTAWRVPLAEGLLTAAFIGEAPVRAEARPAIDSEILRGAGA